MHLSLPYLIMAIVSLSVSKWPFSGAKCAMQRALLHACLDRLTSISMGVPRKQLGDDGTLKPSDHSLPWPPNLLRCAALQEHAITMKIANRAPSVHVVRIHLHESSQQHKSRRRAQDISKDDDVSNASRICSRAVIAHQ